MIIKENWLKERIDIKELDKFKLIKLMVGRDLGDIYASLDKEKEIGDVLLDVENVSSDYVKPVSFQLHRGEVLGKT